jgi:hypothetical protein
MKSLDLSNTKVTSVGQKFMAESCIEELVMPQNFKSTGEYFLQGCTINRVHLSQTALYRVGDYFLSGTAIDEVLLPSTVKAVGNGFDRWTTSHPNFEVSVPTELLEP